MTSGPELVICLRGIKQCSGVGLVLQNPYRFFFVLDQPGNNRLGQGRIGIRLAFDTYYPGHEFPKREPKARALWVQPAQKNQTVPLTACISSASQKFLRQRGQR